MLPPVTRLMNNGLWPILRQALAHPTRVAVVDDFRSWRYLDLLGGAMHLAKRLKQTTDKPHIGLLLPTSGAFPLAMIACWLIRRVPVPINYLLSEAERNFIIDDAGLDTVISVGPMLDYLGSRPSVPHLLELEKLGFRGLPPLRLPPRIVPEQLAVILYTSGTSGKPKGVMLTHANLAHNVRASVAHAGLTHSDGFLGVLPQFHSFGLTGLTLLPLHAGAKVTYTARFVPAKIVAMIRQHRPDIFIAVPSMYAALLGVKDAGPEDFTSLRFAVSGGEPLLPETAEQFQKRFSIRILEGYGLTETSPVVSLCTPTSYRDKSVGRLVPDVQARIVDVEGRDLPAGESGEVWLRGPNVMVGYYGQPKLTAEVLDQDGWLKTGDWGKLDADGFLYITGRKKEMLIIAGENVFPREIEEVLNKHPSIKDSAVVGRVDPLRGEVPIAYVELNEGAPFDEAELRTFVGQQIAQFKVPREVHVVAVLPRSPTGKVLRRQLPG